VEAGGPPPVERHGHFWLELGIAAVLGVTAITTAFAAYKSSVHERETVAHYNEGIRDSSLSTGVLLEAEQTITSDKGLFLEYAKAAETGDKALAAYLLTGLMSPDLKAAVIWWSGHSNKYSTPFVAANPKWNRSELALGNKLSDESKLLFAAAQGTHKTSNRYDLVTVILAAALFLLGVAGVIRRFSLRLGFLAIGVLFLVGSLIQIARIGLGS
jgi:hypothetical protein